MLTKKQMESIPKGTWSNLDINSQFLNHVKYERIKSITVDRFGNYTTNLKKIVAQKLVLLNRIYSK